MHFVIFATVFLLLMAAANFYIYRRFLRVVSISFGRYSWIIPAILMLGEIFFVLDAAFNIIPDSPALYFTTSAFIGFTFMLFVVALTYDLTMVVSRRVPFDHEKRRTLKIIFDVTMLIAAVAYLFRGLSQGVKPPDINEVHVTLKDFPFERYTIVQLTDVHVGRTIKRDFVEDMVQRTNALNPDMVVITGDLVDLPIERIRHDLEPLRRLQSKTYFILGNHEYFHGAEASLLYIKELGIQPLVNECIRIGSAPSHFNLVGIADLSGERLGQYVPDFPRAFAEADITKPSIVLAHQPKSILRIGDHRCDLMLSGHTHGGQIFPFGLLVMVDQPYLAGLHQHSQTSQIFVSRGTGYWGPPLRILAPSEISKIVIKSV